MFLFACGLPVDGQALPITVDVINASLTTSVFTRVVGFDGVPHTKDRTLTSTTGPLSYTLVSDPLPVDPLGRRTPTAEATASAALFNIAAFTAAFSDPDADASAVASTHSIVDFAVAADSLAALSIDFVADNFGLIFAQEFVSLADLTTNTLLKGYSYRGLEPPGGVPDFGPAGQVPWVLGGTHAGVATVAFDQLFQAGHRYRLEMYAQTDSNQDSARMTVGVSGLQPTPEPATLLLFGPGIAVAALHRWRGRRASRR